jgi:carbamoyltransferase
VSHLAEGRVVGWFQGGSEFGPRALGNRSILADPRLPYIRDHINAKVKFREDFRPFAPSVLAEDCATYFDCDYASPHMLLTAPVRPEWRVVIPAVMHKDHSARIQTVTKDGNPLYYALLAAFKEKTGIGLLLNTSLNRRGMPIVETPDDALMLFIYSAIDVLVMEEYIVCKPPDFEARMAKFSALVAQHTARRTFQKVLDA